MPVPDELRSLRGDCHSNRTPGVLPVTYVLLLSTRTVPFRTSDSVTCACPSLPLLRSLVGPRRSCVTSSVPSGPDLGPLTLGSLPHMGSELRYPLEEHPFVRFSPGSHPHTSRRRYVLSHRAGTFLICLRGLLVVRVNTHYRS